MTLAALAVTAASASGQARADGASQDGAWPGLRIEAIDGGDGSEGDALSRLVREAALDSPTLRAVLADIASESDPRDQLRVVAGRSPSGVLIDSFERGLVDLDDLERLPSAHEAGRARDAITREEQIVHILAERRHAARMAARLRTLRAPAASRERLFLVAHEVGLLRENEYRAERGQVAVVDAVSHAVTGAPGDALVEYRLADGRVVTLVTSHRGRIDRIEPAGPAAATFDVASSARGPQR